MQDYTLNDGIITVKVKADGKTVTLDFDTADAGHEGRTLDMAKFQHAEALADRIRNAWRFAGQIPNEAQLNRDSHVILSHGFAEEAHVRQALAAVNEAMQPRQIPPEPPVMQDLAAHAQFIERMEDALAAAASRRSVRAITLEGQRSISAQVFPVAQSDVTGTPAQTDEAEEPKLVAIRIRADKDSGDARAELERITHEAGNVLARRGLDVRMSRMFLGDTANGRQDFSLTLIPMGKSPTETLEAVNGALLYVRQNMGVVKLKLMHSRGEDHRLGASPRPPREIAPDPVEESLRASLRSGAGNGLFMLLGDQAALDEWVKTTANKIRRAQEKSGPDEGAARSI